MATLCKFNASPPRPFVAPNRQLRPSNCPARPQKTPLLIVKSSLQCSRDPVGSHENRNKTFALTSTSFFITSADFIVVNKKAFYREQKVGRQHSAAQKARRLPLKSKATAKKRLRFASQHAPEALAATAR